MTRKQLFQELRALYQEKGLDCTGDHLELLLGVSNHLAEQGISVNREVLDFAVDVLRVKELVGLSGEATYGDFEKVKAMMADWLEALGWRRVWFSRDWTSQAVHGRPA
jgi:hypothetical protein